MDRDGLDQSDRAPIGIRLPERFRSAADIPGLHRPWTAALALGVLEIVGDRAAASPELDGWPGEEDRSGRWLDALRAVCGEINGGAADDSLGLLVLALALLRSLSTGIRLSSREVIDAAHAIADERGLGLMQVHVLGGMSALSRGFLADEVGSLLGLLAEFGAVTAGNEPAVTPLGEWAMERLEADLPRGISPCATALGSAPYTSHPLGARRPRRASLPRSPATVHAAAGRRA